MGITLEQRLSTWDEFLARWPKKRIEELTLEEYVDVKNRDTFAYWLEHKTKILGSIRGGDSSKFGIYRRNKPPKGGRSHIKHGDVYSWLSRFGDTEETAFDSIKNEILKVIDFIEAGDVKAIQEIGLADTLKWKLAFLYQDPEHPKVINIFKRDMLRDACSDPTGEFSDLYSSLLKDRGDTNIVQYGYEIWSSLEDAESDDSEIEVNMVSDDRNECRLPLNTILYGPPGTGKTYNTINKALAIVDPEYLSKNVSDRKKIKARFDELVAKNRIGFVTFHQSFSYEDFVEGLKANSDETAQISYEIEDGIFKRMCAAANAKPIMMQSQHRIDISGRKVWKMSLGDTLGDDAYIYEQCLKNNYVLLGYGYNVDFSASKDRKAVIEAYKYNGIEIENENYDYRVISVNNFKNVMSVGDLIVVSDGNRKFRAIAEVTGDYQFDSAAIEDDGYSQMRKVMWHRVYGPSLPVDELFNKNLSQMTLYRLREPVLDLVKFQEMLAGETIRDSTVSGISVGTQVSSYQVESISDEIISLRKPNGSLLPMPRTIVDSLVSMVSNNLLTIDDIKYKRVFERVDTDMEKYIVNGYPNILAPLVQAIHHYGLDKITVSNDKRVLIIDEINRGNISNIFGELITLIEQSKRAGGSEALSVKLPYSKESFSVPSNLHIIGTMNTADKSLAQVDIALRRRFEFIEMMPKHELLENIDIEGINIAELLKTINQRIELLYDREHTIGHSFFLPLINEPTIERLARIFELEILPLLEEYFFEDWERVGQVLGDHLKSDPKLMFIEEKFTEASVSQLMGSDWLQDGIRPYQRNTKALSNPEAYIGIYDSF
ncbi:AAA family ATPase [Shewanella marina]|uniref:AAA family ATPase n=1 Tax=Shewanella marina TaxID=487319 RepID=UPI000471A2A4|nr:AAA family ATPase [Shewanella marina]